MDTSRIDGSSQIDTDLYAEERRDIGSANGGELLEPPSLPCTGNVMMDVMLLLERSLSRQRRSAELRRDAADNAQEAADKKAVESMRDEARDTFTQALVSGGMTIGAGAVQMVGAGISAHSASLEDQAAEQTKKVNDLSEQGLRASQEAKSAAATSAELTRRAQKLSAMKDAFGAGGSLLAGGSKAADGALGAGVKEDAVRTREHENNSKFAARDVQRENDFARDAHDLAMKTLDRLADLLQSEHQTRLAIIRA